MVFGIIPPVQTEIEIKLHLIFKKERSIHFSKWFPLPSFILQIPTDLGTILVEFKEYHDNEIPVEKNFSIATKRIILKGTFSFNESTIKKMNEIQTKIISDDGRMGKIDDSLCFLQEGKIIARCFEKALKILDEVFRYRLGQYWNEIYIPFDSRKNSIGSWFHDNYQAQWKKPSETEWKFFFPSSLGGSLTGFLHDDSSYNNLIIESDWEVIKKSCEQFQPIPVIEKILSEANFHLENGDHILSLILGVLLIDLLLNEKVLKNISPGKLEQYKNKIEKLPMSAKIIFLGKTLKNSDEIQLIELHNLIKIRDNVVHEGYQITEQDHIDKKIKLLLRFIKDCYNDKMKLPNHSLRWKRYNK